MKKQEDGKEWRKRRKRRERKGGREKGVNVIHHRGNTMGRKRERLGGERKRVRPKREKERNGEWLGDKSRYGYDGRERGKEREGEKEKKERKRLWSKRSEPC